MKSTQVLESELDGLKLELTRKEASVSMLSNEKTRLAGELKVLEGKCFTEAVYLCFVKTYCRPGMELM